MTTPGGMRGIDQNLAPVPRRPAMIHLAFALWLATALLWPLGTVLIVVAEPGFDPVGLAMPLFASVCVAVAIGWGAFLVRAGSRSGRIGVSLGVLLLGFILVGQIVGAARGDSVAVEWIVLPTRLLLSIAAVVASFGPGTRDWYREA
ncbi:hypothetical protein GCM10022243_62780 [Saccharothrix violaceirubra]|uniref:Uncharacterized protein n=1 Tax=Saccharothrix violaceirubra TaxID=413306 RepID=A0A7W7T020_9PSEU|nr:hypothetical protein [Saccharothrix violaceirubra]MBB4962775.1 hypothetical protein [Saccharothrix violaceirubra]